MFIQFYDQTAEVTTALQLAN